MKKKINLFILTMIAVLGLATSCSEYDAGAPLLVRDLYNNAFKEAFDIETISPEQTWGFYIPGNEKTTRAADKWTDTHTDDWMNLLDFKLPSSYVTLTKNENTLRNGSVYYIPADFDGTINFDNFEGDVYVDAEINNFNGNPGNVKIYVLKDGAWKKGTTSGSFTIYNQGTVELGPTDLQTANNIPVIYNGGTLKIGNTNNGLNIADQVKIYSKTDVTLYSNTTIDLKCDLDVHGTINVPNSDFKLQNSKTQHICGINVNGTLDITQGKLETSFVKADYIKFDGAKIWLTEGGWILTNTLYMPNSDTYIYGEANSVGLIEVTGNVTMGNQNFFDKVFSDNIYFKIGGNIKFENSSIYDGTWTSSQYITDTEDGKKVEKRFNIDLEKEGIGGDPACGTQWGKPEDDGDNDDDYGKYGPCRIICEDLVTGIYTGANNSTITHIDASDFDYNDLVFDAEIKNGKIIIDILDLGGTLPIYIEGIEKELHEACEGTTGQMMVYGPKEVGDGTFTSDLKEKGHFEFDAPTLADREFYIHDIRVYVKRSDYNIELGADKGQAPAKICVKKNFKWMGERISIKNEIPSFREWVQDPDKFKTGDREWYNWDFTQ